MGTRDYDVILRNGTIYDGSGSLPFQGDVAIKNDKIQQVSGTIKERGEIEIDTSGLAVAPGFINMLSWANESLIADGRSQGDIRQGVTLEIMGEGSSMGPWNDRMKKERLDNQGDIKYDITWTTLREYLDFLANKGVSTNIASFVGATTIRVNVLGRDDVAPNEEQLDAMRRLTHDAMNEGAFGVASALIYAPAFYAKTDELIALAEVAAEHGGMYTSHLRSEGDALLEALDEFLTIAKVSGARSEIYHLKAAGRHNWPKMDQALSRIKEARSGGLPVSANMYMYAAAQTGLDVAMPPWVQEGGLRQWIERLQNPATRARVISEMSTQSSSWENGYLHAGADGVLLVGLKKLKQFTGMTLAAVAKQLEKTPEETALDLVIQDESRVETVYFWMSEDNIKKQLVHDWISVGSDGSSMSAEGVFLKSSTHPRAYGNVARLLGHYVRDQKTISLEEAVRRLTSLPASNLGLTDRGALCEGFFADIVVFDAGKIKDRATFEMPHKYAVGVEHVFVNGQHVIKEGEHTGATPGRVVLHTG